ncbi:NAD(P)H-binding protein [Actinosynnema sp. NPDC020468]|uniref:NAD(P)H-binding protein n=1 Tax=Actinosynnema sp. NPDC020468 TaxID=3154488 RepID=UPI00340350F3
MTTLITGATGNLGSLIVKHLRGRVPELAVSVRDPAKAEGLWLEVRKGDFDGDLTGVFDGVGTLVLVSVDGPDDLRIARHRNAVAEAVRAGVTRIVYTSVSDADTSPLGLAAVHKATEELIRDTGIPFTFLRNGMYHENYTPALAHGPITTAAGDGRIASVSRDDLALAAAVVASTAGHENKVYELTGPRAWSFAELAELAGTTHVPVSAAEREAALIGFGLPPFVAGLLTDIEVNIGRGALAAVRTDLASLIGRAPVGIEDAVKAVREAG